MLSLAREPFLGNALLLLVVLHRLLEVIVDARHARALARRGGIVVQSAGTALLIVFHVAWFTAVAIERMTFVARMFPRAVVLPLVLALFIVELGRAWVLATLGRRWTMRVVVLPGETPVTSGPYRYARHPNYLVVIAELLLVPLLVGAWRTAIVGSLLHLPVLANRIRREEEAWLTIAGRRLAPARAIRPAERHGERT